MTDRHSVMVQEPISGMSCKKHPAGIPDGAGSIFPPFCFVFFFAKVHHKYVKYIIDHIIKPTTIQL